MEYDAIMNKNYEEDDDEFILADTEESDGSCDLELSQHDYWKCVKCNNRQNNPLYRYCERCYQVSQVYILAYIVKYRFTGKTNKTKHV